VLLLLPSGTYRNRITSFAAVLLPFVSYLLTPSRKKLLIQYFLHLCITFCVLAKNILFAEIFILNMADEMTLVVEMGGYWNINRIQSFLHCCGQPICSS
jgi:hypothetical protein